MTRSSTTRIPKTAVHAARGHQAVAVDRIIVHAAHNVDNASAALAGLVFHQMLEKTTFEHELRS